MIKTLKVLTICLILTISSGCSLFKDRLIEPLCLPDRPELESISIEEQTSIKHISPDLLRRVGENDLKLKSYIRTVDAVVSVHNEQFKVKCFGDTE